MDLRTFFGDWRVDQPILVKQGESEYFARVEQFNNDEVVIKGGTEGRSDFFLYAIKSQANTSGAATYSLELQPGSGLAPSYFSGSDLNGTILLNSPMPSSLIVAGQFKYTSNTLFTTVSGSMVMSREYASAEQSTLRTVITHPSLTKDPIQFIGEI